MAQNLPFTTSPPDSSDANITPENPWNPWGRRDASFARALADRLGDRNDPGFMIDDHDAASLRQAIKRIVLDVTKDHEEGQDIGSAPYFRAEVAMATLDPEILAWCLDQEPNRSISMGGAYQLGSLAAPIEKRTIPMWDAMGFLSELERHFGVDIPMRIAGSIVVAECRTGDPKRVAATLATLSNGRRIVRRILSGSPISIIPPMLQDSHVQTLSNISEQKAVLHGLSPLIQDAIDPMMSAQIVRRYSNSPQLILALLGMGMSAPEARSVYMPQTSHTPVPKPRGDPKVQSLLETLVNLSAHRRVAIMAATRDLSATLRLKPEDARNILIGRSDAA